MSKPAVTNGPQTEKTIELNLLRTVPVESGFHFFTTDGKDTKVIACSTVEFAEKLQSVPIQSVTFHFQHQDFQKWFKNTLGDSELAANIDKIKAELKDEDLRKELLKTIQTRIDALKNQPQKTYASTTGVILIVSYIVLVSFFLLYFIIQFWPYNTGTATTPATSSTVKLFFWTLPIADETRLLIVVILAGSIGSLLHALRSVTWYFGNRNLVTSWYPKYVLMPFAGAIIGLLAYLLLNGGLLALQATTSQTTPFAFAAVSALMGLFSEQAVTKLKQVFEQLFAPPPEGKDSSKPAAQPQQTSA